MEANLDDPTFSLLSLDAEPEGRSRMEANLDGVSPGKIGKGEWFGNNDFRRKTFGRR
jgi:hypothetical protein